LRNDQSALLHHSDVVALALGPVHGVVPRFGRGAKAEDLDGFLGDAALLEVVAGELAGSLVGKGILPATRDLVVDLPERFLEGEDLFLAGGLVEFERECSRVRRGALDGFDEGSGSHILERTVKTSPPLCGSRSNKKSLLVRN